MGIQRIMSVDFCNKFSVGIMYVPINDAKIVPI
jgi:hypothetical protein